MTVIEYKKYFERLKGEGDFSRLGKVFKTKERNRKNLGMY